MKIAVLAKQVPAAESLELLPNGRLRRDGVDLEMSAYCRRAVSKGTELARSTGGWCTVLTLGPPAAEDVLREAVAWGADEGVLVTDPAFAGSDTLATARALAAAVEQRGPFDLVLVGRNSVDADTGQVGPQVAEILGLPFAAGVRELAVADGAATARCELDDGWRRVHVRLPAVMSVAERLCQPAKADPSRRAAVPADRLRQLSAADLGPGPWGAAASRTAVGETRLIDVARRGIVLSGTPAEQVARAVEMLRSWSVLSHSSPATAAGPAPGAEPGGHYDASGRCDGAAGIPDGAGPARRRLVAVLGEPGRISLAGELLGEAARLAAAVSGEVLLLSQERWDTGVLGSLGADRAVSIEGAALEEDVAAAVVSWCEAAQPWAVLAPGTLWGREVAGRAAASLGAGLTGDAVELEVRDGRLVCWKPAFGGRLMAAITATSEVQLATVRPGKLPPRPARSRGHGVRTEVLTAENRERVRVLEGARDDDLGRLLGAAKIVAVGAAVPPEEYGRLEPLKQALDAEFAATRKVTDRGWLPHARQIGLTGQSVSADLYVAIGLAGKFNHMVGTRNVGTVLAVNTDPGAPVFEWADVGLVADWRDVVPLLADALAGVRDTKVGSSEGAGVP